MKTPNHIAIIMDGNGRWAAARKLPRVMGHRAGMEALKRTLRAVRERGVEFLTVYAFSAENWDRPESEISDLMELLRVYLRGELAELHRDGVRLKFIGDHSRLPQDVQNMISESTALTANNTAGTLIIALSYGGRQEIVQAAQRLAQQGAPVTEENFAAALNTAGIPDPDLLIRTSGEMRLSNFLLWQTAYTEFVFTETLWPDFGAKDLDAAITEYQQRERRYGKLGAMA
jgi:undecaprenyl diphosphate synthase